MKKDIKYKRTYVKPSMKVYPLRQKPKLLVGSDTVSATMSGTFTEEDWVPQP